VWLVGEQDTHGHLPIIKIKDKPGYPKDRIKRRSPMMVFFVIGSDNKKYRHLYLQYFPDHSFKVGTRTELKVRYQSTCRSQWQRTKSPSALADQFVREKRAERREKKLLKRFIERYS
jgi:hypothetical protein